MKELIKQIETATDLKRKLYYKLFDEFSIILKTEDPCQWSGHTCAFNRIPTSALKINGCCNKCRGLSIMGCTVESLQCKAVLCITAYGNLSTEAREKWRDLCDIKDKYFNLHCQETFNETIAK